jgi:hypothetical protein
MGWGLALALVVLLTAWGMPAVARAESVGTGAANKAQIVVGWIILMLAAASAYAAVQALLRLSRPVEPSGPNEPGSSPEREDS